MGVEAVDFLTFITPTLGRKTLERTFKSLEAQTDWNWRWSIIWDGLEPNQIFLTDRQFNVVSEKLGHAGLLRNIGIENAFTQWMAFVDDDDWLEPTYIDRLKFYINKDPNLDIVIFSYKDITNDNIQPPPSLRDIKECNVGISFACRTEFIKGNNIKFTPYAIEDFRFLDDAKRAGANYILTHEILYKVGGIGGWLV